MLEFEGKIYARVSDIIRPFVNFGGIPEEVLNRKAALGTRVHEAIENEIKGDMPVVGLQEEGYFKSFDKWRAIVEPRFIETEKRYYCGEKMLSGCIDAIAKLEGEEKGVLIDFKTSAQESPVTWPMQAHLYKYLVNRAGIEVADRFLFLKLGKYGEMPTVYQYKFDNNLFNKCMQAIESYWESQKGCC